MGTMGDTRAMVARKGIGFRGWGYRFAYGWLLRLLAPALLLYQGARWLRDRSTARHWRERWGFAEPVPAGAVWLHAVSVGEVQAAAIVVRALLARSPATAVLLTTTTVTGAARVAALFGDSVMHRYLPLDYPGAVSRFLDRVQPRQLVILETELWPHLLAACRQRDIPVVVASARLSSRTVGRYRRLQALFAPVLEHGVTVLAQTAADAARFVELGVPAARCHVGGNLKFDLEFTPAQGSLAERFRRDWRGAGRRFVWVAGSTHEGEEQVLLAAHAALRAVVPEALLVLVPRHPPRFAAAAANVAATGLPFVRRSCADPVTPATAVLLGDTLGELVACYLAADAAFVGGSLVPAGGHSLVEPAAAALPVFSGRQVGNAPDIAQALMAAGALAWVDQAEGLASDLATLARDPALACARGAAGRAVVADSRGALGRILAEI